MPQAAESGRKWWSKRPPQGIAGAVFWLALISGVIWLLRQVPTQANSLLGWMQLVVALALVALAVPMTTRLIREHLLWSLRNKLILTYLLIGLAPVVLFVTLAAISAYIAAGQFSIHLADTRMRQQLDEIGMDSSAQASRMARAMREEESLRPPPHGPGSDRWRPEGPSRQQARSPNQPAESATAPSANSASTVQPAATPIGESAPNPLLAKLRRHTAVYLNGAPRFGVPEGPGAPKATPVNLPQGTGRRGVPLGLPPWAADLHGNQFRGLVLDGEDLYLVAIDQRHVEGKGLLTVVNSQPVDNALMDLVAQGLGRVRLSGLMTGSSSESANSGSERRRSLGTDLQRTSVYGGAEPQPVNICDFGLPFVSTIDSRDWDTGNADNVPVEVHSRPSLLYRQLFGSSLGGIVTSYIRYGLVALCVLFAILEAIALWAARRLSGQITSSVQELYWATQRVDRGDFQQRIPAVYARKKDQLGELARSFNLMTGSLERLLAEEHEKERLQSELSIAQEVQANLFPHRVEDLPNLQLHGICRPARSVSGDYYDFLVFRNRNDDGSPGAECGVGIALGDISGKGISAALLMATLHSAVRAYRLASDDVALGNGAMKQGVPAGADTGKLFESPGRILALLNRHLYRSTQPEKYATLFLAHYDSATAKLTYSNAGHLPPLVLSRNGNVRRLDCGGTVVGLMDGMQYQEESFQMQSGDVLVAYSDGITEPENEFGEFGEDRLLEVVARYRDQPLHVISAQVMLALDAWIGAAEQPDDITLVLARQI